MRRARTALLVVAVVAVLAGAWVGWQAWHVARSLSAASTEASRLQDELSAGGGDDPVHNTLTDLQGHVRDADRRTSGSTWSVLTHLPLVGDDARAVRLVSSTLNDLSGSGIEPLVDSAADLDSFVPDDGAVPLDDLEALQEPVATADAAFAAADSQLAGPDPDDLFGPLRDKYTELTEKVGDASRALGRAHTALQLMPGMLGADGPRDYLLVFQNNAEVRATGGLPGAVSVLHAENGVLTLGRQVSGASFGEAAEPALPLSPAEQKIYGPQLGTYFLDANFTPDFSRAAALMRARWEQVYPEKIDGVMSLDPVALSYMLKGTGPIKAGDVTIDADNAVDELLSTTYTRLSDPEAQDAFFRDVSSAVFAKVTTGAGSARGILEGLAQAADESRIYVHSFDDDEEALLSRTALDRPFISEDEQDPQVGFYVNDTTGSKMSYYLRYEAKAAATTCLDGVQTVSGTAYLESVAPNDAAQTLPDYVTGGGLFGIPPGSQLVTVRIYGPAGGTFESLAINNEPVDDIGAVDQDGRPVASAYVQLDPQHTTDLSWTMQAGPGQTGDVHLSATPGIESGTTSSTAPTAC